ncbi:MAG: Nramp family divalent metal transporter [Mycobacterium leprae]
MHGQDARTVNAAMDVLEGRSQKSWVARIMPFLGPAFIAAVAYVDPGNFATNIQGGSEYGYMLLWVILAANLMAMLIQSLSAKLGIASGKNLAEHCRDQFPPMVVQGMWFLMELVAIATDLAEFMGAALGFQLLLHVSLLVGAILAALATVAGLALQRYGFRPLEALIGVLLGVVAFSYVAENLIHIPEFQPLLYHTFVPQFAGRESVLLAAGILGATVMPHVIFLHSGLTQGRVVTRDPALVRRLYRFELVDVAVAMVVAGLVNGAMMVMAAATFHARGQTVGTIEAAHQTLAPLLGNASSVVFAVSLLASGLSSSIVGTMSGQVIMQGFLHRQIPVWVRRVVTLAPSFIVILLGLDPTRTLVLSQVALSFGLPFAVIPLVMFTSRKAIMGQLVNSRLTNLAATLVAGLILLLNIYLLFQLLIGG